jgi:hypothetical protein
MGPQSEEVADLMQDLTVLTCRYQDQLKIVIGVEC